MMKITLQIRELLLRSYPFPLVIKIIIFQQHLTNKMIREFKIRDVDWYCI